MLKADDDLRWEKVQETAQAMAKVLRESSLNYSEGVNVLIQLVYECCMYMQRLQGLCPRCTAVALVECLMMQPGLTHLAEDAGQFVKKKKGDHDGCN